MAQERNGVRKIAACARQLQASADAELRARGALSGKSTVEVNYFALCDLLDYFKETREAARRVIVARDALHQVFFSSADH